MVHGRAIVCAVHLLEDVLLQTTDMLKLLISNVAT